MDIISIKSTIVGYEESRDILAIRNEQVAVDLTPVEGSERAFLDLELPNGEHIRSEISYADFNHKIVPLLNNF